MECLMDGNWKSSLVGSTFTEGITGHWTLIERKMQLGTLMVMVYRIYANKWSQLKYQAMEGLL